MSILWFTVVAALAGDAPERAPLVVHDPGDAVQRLVRAQPFTLTEPMADTMRAGAPEVREGWLVQLQIRPDFARPRQARMPVLYADMTPARPFWANPVSGCTVAMVPGDRELADVVFFYGSMALPSRVDAARGAEELAAARALGLGPRPVDEVAAAVAAGGPALVGDGEALWQAAHTWAVEACSKPER